MRYRALMRYYQPFPAAIPLYEAGYPRVTHPSATNFEKQALHRPFDLHVLSTPPAFILSQDQTLMLKVLIQPEYLAFLNQKQVPTGILIQVLLFLRFALLKAVRSSFDDLNYSLMNLSRLFTVQLSMFFVVFSNSDILSRSEVFVNNFFIFLFQLFRADVLSFLTALIFYQIVCRLSTTFSKKFEQHILQIRAEKEGFEPSRRLPDLYP